ncbi:hypothetical protein T310_6243, partial [Rasamsonia emersonii CBS 393.64]
AAHSPDDDLDSLQTGESLDERVVAAQLLRICLISALVEGLAQVVITVNILVDGSARQLIDPQIKPNQPVETYNIPVSLSSHTAFLHSIPELLGCSVQGASSSGIQSQCQGAA